MDDPYKDEFEMAARVRIFSERFEEFAQVFISNSSTIPQPVRASFAAMSLAHADMHQRVSQIVEDHPTLFEDPS